MNLSLLVFGKAGLQRKSEGIHVLLGSLHGQSRPLAHSRVHLLSKRAMGLTLPCVLCVSEEPSPLSHAVPRLVGFPRPLDYERPKAGVEFPLQGGACPGHGA